MKSNVYMLMMLMFIKMFKKFKRQLSKTILNKKLKLVFLFLFVLGFLFNGSTAQALFGVGDFGIFDVAQVQLDALDFIDSTILKYFILLLALILESTIFSALSASLLQWAINLPINLGNGLVIQGWNFVAGISNAFLVLILVFIALAYILKIETLDAKKALPKFILIALLINFSKVFVGIFVDIADIFQNTISIALGADFVSLAIEPLVASGASVLAWLIGIILGYAGIALIPYGNVAALIILLTLFITGPLFQILGEAVVLIIFNVGAGMIFLFFTGLFLMRIAMIWILTIFSPLAFVASVLKTTKKHWDKWLNMLVSWSFLGIVVLFLLGLGLKFLGVIIAEPEQFSLTMEGGTFLFQKSMYYYLFMLVYLGVVFKLSKEGMPEFAQALIDQTKTLAKGGGKILGKSAVKSLRKVAVTQSEKEEKWKDVEGWKGRLGRGWTKARRTIVAKPVRWAYRMGGTTPEIAAKKESKTTRAEEAKKMMEGQTEEAQRAELKAALDKKSVTKLGKSRAVSRVVGIMEAMIKDGTLGKAEKDGIFGKEEKKKYMAEEKNMGRRSLQLYDTKTAAELDKRWDNSDEKIQKEIIREILVKIKPSDVKLMSEGSLTNEVMKEAIVDTFNGNQMAEIGKNFGMNITEGIQEEIEGREKAKKIAERNPSLALWLHGNTAQNLGFGLPEKNITRPRIQELVKEGREKIQKEREAKETAELAEGLVEDTPDIPSQ